jgi:hypothetical protein
LCESDNGWSCPGTLGVLDNPWGLALHHSDGRVGGTCQEAVSSSSPNGGVMESAYQDRYR